MKLNWKLTASAVAMAVSSGLHADVLPTHQAESAWFTDAQSKIEQKLEVNNKFKAKNVILFVGDGMGVSTL
ncbi:MAG: alkaline phosphatase, partial [Pseudomonadota bacterium]|nr:alkaline phosphatase [Pseudomonadota bacterium]